MEVLQLIDSNYKVIKNIKSGGFGVIYLGWDIALDRPVAIKEIHPFLFEDELFIKMFQDEARNTAKLNHPNIVTVYSLRKMKENRFYIIMEYIEGLDLRTVLNRLKKSETAIPKDTAIAIISDICKALEYAHTKVNEKTGENLEIIHRDVSPSNIMISTEGAIKLIDFGIAKARFRSIEKSGLGFIKGKLPYMSPEQVESKQKLDHRTDIFSLGVILFELLSNEKLYKTERTYALMKEVANAKIDESRIHKLDTTDEIKQTILKCLQKKPEKRFQSAAEISSQLDIYLHSLEHFNKTNAVKALLSEVLSDEDTVQTIISLPREKLETTDQTEFVHTEEIASHQPKETTPHRLVDDSKTMPVQATEMVFDRTALRSDEPDETEKTIFDLVKLSSRTYKKQIYMGIASLLVAMIAFLALDTKYRWTSIGQSIYDSLFPPSLTILSVPSGAKVYLDGDLIGTTNARIGCQIAKISPGSHKLRLTLDGYEQILRAVEVQSNVVTQNGEAVTQLTYRFNTNVQFTSTPSGAEIYINDERTRYTTPYTLTDWEVGTELKIEFRLAGFNPIRDCILDTETGNLNNVDRRIWNLSTKPGERLEHQIHGKFFKPVIFQSRPPGAEVYLNDQSRQIATTGTSSPISLTVGTYSIIYKKKGFLDNQFQLVINKDTPDKIDKELLRDVSIRTIDAYVSNREVNARISNIYSMQRQQFPENVTTPTRLKFGFADHYLTLKRDSYQDTTVKISKFETSITVNMKPLFIVNVTDRTTGASIADGQIYFKSRDTSDGLYQFFSLIKNGQGKRVLAPSDYTFRVVKDHYQPAEKRVTVNYVVDNSLNLMMVPVIIKEVEKDH